MGRENVRRTYCVETILPRLTQTEHEQFEDQAKHERKTHDDEQPMRLDQPRDVCVEIVGRILMHTRVEIGRFPGARPTVQRACRAVVRVVVVHGAGCFSCCCCCRAFARTRW